MQKNLNGTTIYSGSLLAIVWFAINKEKAWHIILFFELNNYYKIQSKYAKLKKAFQNPSTISFKIQLGKTLWKWYENYLWQW